MKYKSSSKWTCCCALARLSFVTCDILISFCSVAAKEIRLKVSIFRCFYFSRRETERKFLNWKTANKTRQAMWKSSWSHGSQATTKEHAKLESQVSRRRDEKVLIYPKKKTDEISTTSMTNMKRGAKRAAAITRRKKKFINSSELESINHL